MKSKTSFHAEGLCSLTWHLTAYIFSEDLAEEKYYYSQDAARTRSVKGNYQGHRGQRSRSLCNFIGQKGTISTINDLFVLN